MNCPTCGKPMDLDEKDTSSGCDRRTYGCPRCKVSVDVDRGQALWRILSDEREKNQGNEPRP